MQSPPGLYLKIDMCILRYIDLFVHCTFFILYIINDSDDSVQDIQLHTKQFRITIK